MALLQILDSQLFPVIPEDSFELKVSKSGKKILKASSDSLAFKFSIVKYANGSFVVTLSQR